MDDQGILKTAEGHPSESLTNWLARAADTRGNLIRITGIAGFYSIHLLNVYLPVLGLQTLADGLGLGQTEVPRLVHLGVSMIALAWMMQAFAIHVALDATRISNRAALAIVLGDVIWLSTILCCSVGAGGAMVAAYFLIVVVAGLRLNLWLVRWSTVAAAIGYLAVLGFTRWPVGVIKQLELQPVPRYHQLMVLVAIALTGIAVGQTARLAWAAMVRREGKHDR